FGSVVSNFSIQPAGKVFFDFVQLSAHTFDDFDGVGIGQWEDAHKDGGLAGEAHFSVVVLGAELYFCDIAQAHDGVIFAAKYEVFKLFDGVQVCVGGQVDLDVLAFGVADGREKIVCGKSTAHFAGADAEGGHFVRIKPDP